MESIRIEHVMNSVNVFALLSDAEREQRWMQIRSVYYNMYLQEYYIQHYMPEGRNKRQELRIVPLTLQDSEGNDKKFAGLRITSAFCDPDWFEEEALPVEKKRYENPLDGKVWYLDFELCSTTADYANQATDKNIGVNTFLIIEGSRPINPQEFLLYQDVPFGVRQHNNDENDPINEIEASTDYGPPLMILYAAYVHMKTAYLAPSEGIYKELLSLQTIHNPDEILKGVRIPKPSAL